MSGDTLGLSWFGKVLYYTWVINIDNPDTTSARLLNPLTYLVIPLIYLALPFIAMFVEETLPALINQVYQDITFTWY